MLNDDLVLELKLPYHYTYWTIDSNNYVPNYGTSYINFSALPDSSASSLDSIVFADNRGLILNLDTNVSGTSIYIYNKMLPVQSVYGTDDITISAEYKCNGESINNPFLTPGDPEQPFTPRIDSIGIEVIYHGNLDVAIDWLKIETPAARMVFDGMVDDTIANYVQDYLLDHFTDTSYYNKGIKLSRMYSVSECPMSNWEMIRYFRELLGDFIISWQGAPHSQNWDHFLNMPTDWYYWHGLTRSIANPYFRKGGEYWGYNPNQPLVNPYKMNMKFGYAWDTVDTLNSGYETELVQHRNFSEARDAINEDFIDLGNQSGFFQMHYETRFAEYFQYTKHNWFLFREDNWIGQIHPMYRWKLFQDTFGINATVNFERMLSAEELRFFINNIVFLGGKGITYDGPNSSLIEKEFQDWLSGSYPTNIVSYTRIAASLDSTKVIDTLNLSELEYLKHSKLGGDFIQASNDRDGLHMYLDLNRIADSLDVSPERIYIGRESNRMEIYKQHKWIRLNEDTLLDLRLQNFLSKGFKSWFLKHPINLKYRQKDLLNQYIDIPNTRTRKLFQPNLNLNHNTNPDLENRDSSFFELAFHNEKNNLSINDKFNHIYLGILNRRTDPLIFNSHIDGGVTLKEIQFYSGAEFDDFVRDSNSNNDLFGIARDSSWWQVQWWKRLGCREIQIPFNVEPYGNGNVLEIKELGVDQYSNLGWWYADKYYHKIDTLIPFNGTLISKHLPGQGKMVKIDFRNIFNQECDVCDIINDFDKISFSIDSVGPGCCYKIEAVYLDDCPMEDLEIRVSVEANSNQGLTFGGNPFNDSTATGNYYIDTTFDLDTAQTINELGIVCVPDDLEEYTISILIGKDTLNRFSACDRKIKYDLVCGQEPLSCCDSLGVSSIYEEIYLDGFLISCCNRIFVDEYSERECFYGVDLTLSNKLFEELIPLSENSIDFTTYTNGEIGSICFPPAKCYYQGPEPPDELKIYLDMNFRDSDGTILCLKPIEVEVCCHWILHSILTGEPILGKSPSNFEFDNRQELLINEKLYPNPNDGNFTLEFDLRMEKTLNIYVLNIEGKVIKSIENEDYLIGKNKIDFIMNEQARGKYFVVVNGPGVHKVVNMIVE